MPSSYLELAKSAFLIGAPLVGGGVGSYLTRVWPRSTWYKDLKKPWFTPPNWVFGPVWTTLYSCMGYSSYLVWRDGSGDAAQLPLTLFGSHMILNWIWSPVFFNRKDYGLATAIIALMDCSLVACIYLFRDINVTASNLLLPYMGWLSLASALTAYIWWNNKPAEAKYRMSLLGYPLTSAAVASGKQK